MKALRAPGSATVGIVQGRILTGPFAVGRLYGLARCPQIKINCLAALTFFVSKESRTVVEEADLGLGDTFAADKVMDSAY